MFYNDPHNYAYEAKAKKFNRYKEVEGGKKKDIDIEFIIPDEPRAVRSFKVQNGWDF